MIICRESAASLMEKWLHGKITVGKRWRSFDSLGKKKAVMFVFQRTFSIITNFAHQPSLRAHPAHLAEQGLVARWNLGAALCLPSCGNFGFRPVCVFQKHRAWRRISIPSQRSGGLLLVWGRPLSYMRYILFCWAHLLSVFKEHGWTISVGGISLTV